MLDFFISLSYLVQGTQLWDLQTRWIPLDHSQFYTLLWFPLNHNFLISQTHLNFRYPFAQVPQILTRFQALILVHLPVLLKIRHQNSELSIQFNDFSKWTNSKRLSLHQQEVSRTNGLTQELSNWDTLIIIFIEWPHLFPNLTIYVFYHQYFSFY